MLNSILVAVDDSGGALAALQWAESVVAKERAKGKTPAATMLTVWSPPAIDIKGIFANEPFEEVANKTLHTLADRLTNPEWFEQLARKGHPSGAIIDEADRRDSDLIVIGTRGRSPVAQVLLGSVSRVVAGRADRPVAIVPESFEPADGQTVVAFDNSPGSRAALEWALDNTDGEIIVLSVWFLPNTIIIDPEDPKAQAVRDATEEVLMAGIEEVSGGTMSDRIQPVLRHGDPRLTILDTCPPGVQIVLGARGERGLKGLLLGSTVTYVATHSTVPVIVVPPPHEDS